MLSVLYAQKQPFSLAGAMEQIYAYRIRLCSFLVKTVQFLAADSHWENILK